MNDFFDLLYIILPSDLHDLSQVVTVHLMGFAIFYKLTEICPRVITDGCFVLCNLNTV